MTEEHDAVGPGREPFTDEEIAKHFAGKEFNLSEKIKDLFEVKYLDSMADVQGDVSVILKEFIKRERKLLYEVFKSWEVDKDIIMSVIVSLDKLAGDKLNGI